MTYKACNTIEPDQLMQLYDSCGWINYTNKPDVMANIIPRSLYSYAAFDGDKLVGLIRVVGDGVSIIYVQDILVTPTHQRQGIGTHLLKHVLKRYQQVRQILLITEDTEKTKAFYRSLGMKTLKETHALGFIKYNM